MTRGERVYRLLLGAYPAAFRASYAEPLVQLFRDRQRERLVARESVFAFWLSMMGDVLTSAASEHLRRNRAVAQSIQLAPPSPVIRVLGLAGVLAGVALLVVFLVQMPQGLNPLRLVLYSSFVIAVMVGVHLRQAEANRRLSSVALTAAVVGNVLFVGMIALEFLGVDPVRGTLGVVFLFAGLGMWLADAAFAAVMLRVGRFHAWAPLALLIGSVLAATGNDRLGLVGAPGAETVFNQLALLGIALHGLGLIGMGVELALRRTRHAASDRPSA